MLSEIATNASGIGKGIMKFSFLFDGVLLYNFSSDDLDILSKIDLGRSRHEYQTKSNTIEHVYDIYTNQSIIRTGLPLYFKFLSNSSLLVSSNFTSQIYPNYTVRRISAPCYGSSNCSRLDSVSTLSHMCYLYLIKSDGLCSPRPLPILTTSADQLLCLESRPQCTSR